MIEINLHNSFLACLRCSFCFGVLGVVASPVEAEIPAASSIVTQETNKGRVGDSKRKTAEPRHLTAQGISSLAATRSRFAADKIGSGHKGTGGGKNTVRSPRNGKLLDPDKDKGDSEGIVADQEPVKRIASKQARVLDEKRRSRDWHFHSGEFRSAPIDQGFVFANGQFLPGPYIVRSSAEKTLINDVTISHELCRYERRFRRYEFDEEGRESRTTDKTLAEFVASRFEEDMFVLIAFDGQQPILIQDNAGGRDLLFAFLTVEDRKPVLSRVTPSDQGDSVKAVWDKWFLSYEPTAAFRQKAQPIVDRINEQMAEDKSRRLARQRLGQLAYPLTLVGMIVSVFAIGHLISHPPNTGITPDEIDDAPEVLQILKRSLVIVVFLSTLDLAWTLLVSQAGEMREINPIGGRLIDRPEQLILFKAVMTTLAIGLLFRLRRYRRAQLAAWWSCLVLTLLTVRWLTFNSMLV